MAFAYKEKVARVNSRVDIKIMQVDRHPFFCFICK